MAQDTKGFLSYGGEGNRKGQEQGHALVPKNSLKTSRENYCKQIQSIASSGWENLNIQQGKRI